MSIRFVRKGNYKDDYIYSPPPATYTFFQICSFRNPENAKYGVRAVMINELCEIVKYKDYHVSGRICKKLMDKKKTNEYKVYNTYALDLIDLPDMDELMRLQSPLLN